MDKKIPEARLITGFLNAGVRTFKDKFWIPFFILAIITVAVHGGLGIWAGCRAYSRNKAEENVRATQEMLHKFWSVEKTNTICKFTTPYGDRDKTICYFEDYNGKNFKFSCYDNMDCQLENF